MVALRERPIVLEASLRRPASRTPGNECGASSLSQVFWVIPGSVPAKLRFTPQLPGNGRGALHPPGYVPDDRPVGTVRWEQAAKSLGSRTVPPSLVGSLPKPLPQQPPV